MSRIAFAAAVFLALTAAPAATADAPVRIEYHEPAIDFRLQVGSFRAAAGKPLAADEPAARFSAFGRQFDIDLVGNGRIAAGLLARGALAAPPPLFSGELRGIPGSWVRLALVDGRPFGAIWDGNELFLVDTAGRFGVAGADPDAVTVVRASDLHIPVDAVRFAAGAGPGGDAAVRQGTAAAPAAGAAAALTAIPVGLVLDASFGGFPDPVAYALALANVVDGIFVAQLDLHINIEHVLDYPTEPDPFTGSDGNALLDQLADLKNSNAALRQMGIAHLLTGTELGGDTVGIATIGRVCANREGVSVTRDFGHVATALIMAHELGHNFGAQHDGEPGSVCAATATNYIMAPTINDSRLFSACSVQTMLPYIASAACRTPVPVADVATIAPTVDAPVWYGDELWLDFTVQNVGVESTLQNVLQFATNNPEPARIYDYVNPWCTFSGPGPVSACAMQSIPGGASATVVVNFVPKIAGTMVVDATVSAANDGNPGNDTDSVEIEVRPATDFGAVAAHASGDSLAGYAQPGWPVSLLAGARNLGDFPSDASIVVTSDNRHVLEAPPGCTMAAADRMHCDFGELAPGMERLVEFTATIDPDIALELWESRHEDFYVAVDSMLHDTEDTNDRMPVSVTLVGSIHDIALEFAQRPAAMKVGESRSFAARIDNNGPDASPAVILSVFGSGLEFTEWSIGRGECLHNAASGWLDCDIDGLESGASINLSVTYSSETARTYPVTLQAYTQYGLDNGPAGNALLDAAVVVSGDAREPNAAGESSGGGGGTFSWAHLLLLLGALAMRRRAGRVHE